MHDEIGRLRAALADRYRFERELGRGAMGVVYLARDLKHGRPVALKVLHSDLSSALAVARFSREIQITARLQHPHIVPLFDSGEAAGHLYYVMPYVAVESLKDRLDRERQLPLEQALAIAADVAAALDYAHAANAVHRDIKPGNILLESGMAVVADFGIGRAIQIGASDALTATGLTLGTPSYMSPEQAAGDAKIDGRTDIYALGCVLYEMLAGEPPFPGRNAQAVLARQVHGAAPPLSSVRPTIPPSLEAVVMKALAKVPADRYQTAAEFARALRSARNLSEQTPKSASSRIRVFAVPVAALLLVIGSLSWRSFVRAGSTEPKYSGGVALLPCEALMPSHDSEFTADRWSEELIQKLVAVGGLNPKSWVSMRRYRNTQLRLREIGEELNAGAVIRCRMAEGANRVRLAVELIRPDKEEITWSSEYERPAGPEGINEVQTAAARDISAALRIRPAGRAASSSAPLTRDAEALRLYRLGKHLKYSYDSATARRSLEYFRAAVARDPAFARAYVELAEAVRTHHEKRPWNTIAPEVGRLLRKGLSMDPTIAEGYTGLARHIFASTHDWVGAEDAHRQAVALDPSSAEVRVWYGYFLLTTERIDEAVAQFDTAVQLDPVDHLSRGQLVRALTFGGDEARALREIKDGLELNATWGPFHYNWALLLLKQGKRDSALAVIQRGGTRAEKGWLFAIAGRPEPARAELEAMLARDLERVDASVVAQLYAGLGEYDEALDWLERAYAQRSEWLLFLLGPHPAFDAVRRHPRFRELRRKVGFPEAVHIGFSASEGEATR